MATYIWENAHDWLREMRDEGHITDDELVDWILDIVDGDQIQDRFQSFMDEMGYFEDLDEPATLDCPECGTTTTDITTIQDHGMCLDCLHEREDSEDWDDPEDEIVYTWIKEALTYRIIWLNRSDFDYLWKEDRNAYPNDATAY